MDQQFLIFLAVGFAAQMVDGAIGMAYGATSSSILLSMGIPPATTSASVHAAKVFTSGASGLAHWRYGNYDFGLVRRLALFGMLGGAIGAIGVVYVPVNIVTPVVAIYLMLLGLLIIARALQMRRGGEANVGDVRPLGFIGGFVDAVGGGGWGPVVTSTLLQRQSPIRETIGSVNIAEFFVSVVIATLFIATIGLELWTAIAGLIVGGIIAAPVAAYATKFLAMRAERLLMLLVGLVVCALALRSLLKVFG